MAHKEHLTSICCTLEKHFTNYKNTFTKPFTERFLGIQKVFFKTILKAINNAGPKAVAVYLFHINYVCYFFYLALNVLLFEFFL